MFKQARDYFASRMSQLHCNREGGGGSSWHYQKCSAYFKAGVEDRNFVTAYYGS